MTATVAQNIADNLNLALKNYTNVVLAHDHVHPDRDECGGVGGCALMMTEHTVGEDVQDGIEYAARSGFNIGVNLTPRTENP